MYAYVDCWTRTLFPCQSVNMEATLLWLASPAFFHKTTFLSKDQRPLVYHYRLDYHCRLEYQHLLECHRALAYQHSHNIKETLAC